MSRRFLLFLSAVLIALVGVGAVFTYAHGADARAMSGQEPVKVLVAKTKIPAGTTADQAKSMTSQELLPAKAVPQGALDDLATVSGRVATTDIYAGQVVLAALFG